MDTIILFIFIILVASILQTSTGFGFSIMATPFLLLIFQSQEAIQINIILSLVISISLIWQIKSDVDFKLFKRFSIGSVLGVPFGIIIYLLFNIEAFKITVSILLLLLTVLLILQFKWQRTLTKDYIIGGFSSLLTTSIGMPGPPLLLYFTGVNAKKETVRATTLAFFLFIYFVSLVTQIAFSGTSLVIWESSAYAIPIVFLGLLIGQKLYKKINQQVFRVFTYVLLISTGLYLLFDTLWF